MAENEVKLPSIENHPVKILVTTVLATVVGAWIIIRPAMVDDLSTDFIPNAQAEVAHKEIKDTMDKRMDALEDKIDYNSSAVKGLQTEVRLTAAFQLERSIKMDLEAHKAQQAGQRDPNWQTDVNRLTRQLKLATDYKECVLYDRPNCDHLQRQLWQ